MLESVPELPEVETTRRGLAPHVVGRTIERLVVRERRLRWPIAPQLERSFAGQTIVSLERRAKYLLLELGSGSALIHLGMSGSLRFVTRADAIGAHDHYDIALAGGRTIRYNDPRRFGSLHFTTEPESHPLLRDLGPEPLGETFDGDCLWASSRGRKTAVKAFIMNGHIVVGVGNIYANEALFRAGIHPARPAGRISRERYARLAAAIRAVLADALAQGGTTLRDFVGSDGRPGYFRQSLAVYERDGEACRESGHAIRRRVIGQRASYYCPACQR
jgi:formamidopyrimidine-DNA glycosylase